MFDFQQAISILSICGTAPNAHIMCMMLTDIEFSLGYCCIFIRRAFVSNRGLTLWHDLRQFLLLLNICSTKQCGHSRWLDSRLYHFDVTDPQRLIGNRGTFHIAITSIQTLVYFLGMSIFRPVIIHWVCAIDVRGTFRWRWMTIMVIF